METSEHVISALKAAEKHDWPYPHFFTENVFPSDFYADLQRILTEKRDFHAEKFANRQFADSLADLPGLAFMQSKLFFKAMLYLFLSQAQTQFGGRQIKFSRDIRLIRDRQHYKIGPHTDAPWKVLSLLFYLPATDEFRDYGTSIFVPQNPNFTCAGGPHYPFEGFNKIYTAPFVPNSCFGFWKTPKSFHGVSPIPIDFQRDVLLYNIYQEIPPDASS